ncbi:MAG: CDP-alcohol phosphatidyltransferase family protein [Nanoarchaeota archaeon]
MGLIEKSREYRSKKLAGVGRFLVKLGISANLLTFLSFISGLLAVYFLFDNYVFFVIFALFHLLFDSIDGVVARLSKTSKFGEYFDWVSDQLVTFSALVKTGWFIGDFYAYIVAGIFALAFIIFLWSKFKAPMYFIRLTMLIILSIVTFPFLPYTKTFLTGAYLTAGVISVYSLARQMQWWMERR